MTSRLDARIDHRLDILLTALMRQTGPDGTLWDPVQEGPTPPDHYAQISTALALQLRQPGDALSRKLLEAWLALPPNQRGHAPFNRFLLLLLGDAINARADEQGAIDAALIAEGLSHCPLVRHYPSNNWALLAQLCRIMEAGSRKVRRQAALGLEHMLDRWTTPAGGFVDFPRHGAKFGGATPMAYHHKALFVTVMALHYTDSPGLANHVRRMQDWVSFCWDGQNHVGGFGRSTHSLFGDACLLASLILLGSGEQANPGANGSKIITGILERWSGQSRDDGLLALNPAGQQGWDNYMFLSVYNAWAAAIIGWARHSTATGKRINAHGSVFDAAPSPLEQDPDAGLLRIGAETELLTLLSTRGQPPQAFSRDEIELRYAGGTPWHVIHRDRVVCPPAVRSKATALLERPALAGWTPVFSINGRLFGLTEFTSVQVQETDQAYRIILAGSPLPLLRPAASTPWQRLKAAIDWRFLDGALGRREVFQRKPARQLQARLVISLSRQTPELTHELTLERLQAGTVRYLNPAGHALIANALPRTKQLEIGTLDKTRTVDGPFHDTLLDAAITGATGYCLAQQPLGPEGYRHRLVFTW